jgi:hypothetical protein
MALKSGFKFRIIPSSDVRASDASDLPMVGYLLELCCEGPLAGASMIMSRPSSVGSSQVLPQSQGNHQLSLDRRMLPMMMSSDGWRIDVTIGIP